MTWKFVETSPLAQAILLHSFSDPLGTWKRFTGIEPYVVIAGVNAWCCSQCVTEGLLTRAWHRVLLIKVIFESWRWEVWLLRYAVFACVGAMNPSPSCGYPVLKQSHNHFGLPALEITSDLWHATIQGTFTKCANTVFKLLSTKMCQVREPLWHETEATLNWLY